MVSMSLIVRAEIETISEVFNGKLLLGITTYATNSCTQTSVRRLKIFINDNEDYISQELKNNVLLHLHLIINLSSAEGVNYSLPVSHSRNFV